MIDFTTATDRQLKTLRVSLSVTKKALEDWLCDQDSETFDYSTKDIFKAREDLREVVRLNMAVVNEIAMRGEFDD